MLVQISFVIGDWKRERISNGLRIDLDSQDEKVEEMPGLLPDAVLIFNLNITFFRYAVHDTAFFVAGNSDIQDYFRVSASSNPHTKFIR